MRALTMDEVGVVSGGGILPTYNSSGVATLTNSGSSAPSFISNSPNGGTLFGGAVNGGFASQDAQLQCYADWLNAGCPDIQGQSAPDYLEEVKVTAQRVGQSDVSVPNAALGTGFAQMNNLLAQADAEEKYAQACINMALTRYLAGLACYDTEADIWPGLGAGYSSGKGLSYEVTVDEHKLDGVVNLDASTTVDHKIYNFNGEVTGGSSEKYGFGVSVKENVSEVIRGVNNAINNIGQEMYRYYKGMEIDLIKAD